ncbi:TetR/AcrR family transcriptional regulator [Actinobacteria bacterium YIM 96077]|uniref:TetR family transcriptional regulator n=1 Tax=Phytoactinopolyspora halophila TaxID=1981511 RepID=A0A329QDZ1_9ACTN|nr:TetR/AcrR family transcriptional regulator [Phytoactinopolyspora halophila]AYY14187.1 TetR/AcrR family transcriptional regulator [Actinobacteria bacterium YIM 96077]RAW10221.1 TetR family transcriptional regulator [Phytoactinopolyspora halophila]
MASTSERALTQKRPGGRSARVRAAVLKATLEELVAVGYGLLTIEGVAERAGVHKTTIYRRWGDRETLVLEAMLERGSREVPIPDTGSLRQDLLEYGRAVLASSMEPEVEAVVRAVAAIGDSDPRVAEAARTFWRTRFALASRMIERATERGEIPPPPDAALIAEMVIAPIYFRMLVSRERMDSEFMERVADLAAEVAGAQR